MGFFLCKASKCFMLVYSHFEAFFEYSVRIWPMFFRAYITQSFPFSIFILNSIFINKSAASLHLLWSSKDPAMAKANGVLPSLFWMVIPSGYLFAKKLMMSAATFWRAASCKATSPLLSLWLIAYVFSSYNVSTTSMGALFWTA